MVNKNNGIKILVLSLVMMVIGAGSVLANHSSDSNVITPGFEACNVYNTL